MRGSRLVVLALALVAFGFGVWVWLDGAGAGGVIVVALCVGIALTAPRIGVPAALAFVVVATLAAWTVVGELARLGPPSATLWNWVFLLAAFVPVVVGAALRVLAGPEPSRLALELRMRRHLLLAMLPGALIVAIPVYVAHRRYGVDGFAWVMSGDARNTIQSAFEAFSETIGGQGLMIDPTGSLYAALAVVGSSPHATPAGGLALLDHAIVTLAALTLGTLVLFTISAASLVVQIGGARDVPVFAVMGASIAPVLGIGMGIGLQDGFVSSFVAILVVSSALVLTAYALGAGCPPRMRFAAAFAIALACIVVLFTWAYVVVGLLPLLLAVIWWSWRAWSRWMRIVVVGTALVGSAGLLTFMPRWIHHTIGNNVFSMTGTIVAPTTWLLVIAAFGIVALICWPGQHGGRRFLVAALAATLAATAMVLLIIYEPAGPPGYPYYAAKLTWVWTASILPLAFVPVIYVFGRGRRSSVTASAGLGLRGVRSDALALIGAGAMAIAILVGVRTFSTLDSPFLVIQPIPWSWSSPIANGWTNPSVGAVAAARAAANTPNAVVYGVTDPGNDRLANFWLNVIPDNAGGDFKGWAYYTTGDIASICDLLSRDPTRTVVTRDAGIEKTIREACRISAPRVKIIG